MHIKHERSRPALLGTGAALACVLPIMLASSGAGAATTTSEQVAASPAVQLSIGAEFTSGEYGGDRTVEDLYVPVTGSYRTGRYSMRVTVPYLRVDAPEGTIIEGPGGQPIPGDGPNVTESGLGDVILGLTMLDVWNSRDHSLAIDVGGKVKLGTADEAKGLGTGETDYTVQADLIRLVPGFTAIASVGYVFRGDPDEFDLDDGVVASVGGVFDARAGMKLGAFLDYRQAAYEFNDDRVELVGLLGWRMLGSRLYITASTGLSDSAPDWGVGITVAPGR